MEEEPFPFVLLRQFLNSTFPDEADVVFVYAVNCSDLCRQLLFFSVHLSTFDR